MGLGVNVIPNPCVIEVTVPDPDPPVPELLTFPHTMPQGAVEDAVGTWPLEPNGKTQYWVAFEPTSKEPFAGTVLVPVPPPVTGETGAAFAIPTHAIKPKMTADTIAKVIRKCFMLIE